MRTLLSTLAACLLPSAAFAQSVRVALFGAGGDYREQSAALAFDGKGGAGRVEVSVGRFGLSATGSRLSYTRGTTAAPDAEPFVAKELEVTGRIRVVSVVSLEAGAIRRWITPDRAAQAVRVGRVGLRADYGLAPGADAKLRAAYLTRASFSGGGSAEAGVGLGFGLSYGAKRRGPRITADYDFLRINRETAVGGLSPVPIQSSTARLGVLLIF
jgi:hypothetical protein